MDPSIQEIDISPIYLNGKRTTSSRAVLIPKYEVPILPEIKKKIVTKNIDRKISIQDVGSNSFKRFQVGATLDGNLENQYCGRYCDPGAQIDTVPRP